MSTQPDWSKAPKGATHWSPLNLAFYKQVENGYVRADMVTAGLVTDTPEWIQQLVRRPWTGDGLPPVGTVCQQSTMGEDWTDVRILAHTVLNGEHVAVFEYGGASVSYATAEEFRPLRTPEQIAAEEREKAIAAMIAISKTGDDDEEICAALYDAGYRKHDAQQQHELQVSSDIHQANRELAEQRLRRLAEIEGQMNKMNGAVATQETAVVFFNLQAEKREILSHYREPQA